MVEAANSPVPANADCAKRCNSEQINAAQVAAARSVGGARAHPHVRRRQRDVLWAEFSTEPSDDNHYLVRHKLPSPTPPSRNPDPPQTTARATRWTVVIINLFLS